jgi:hypothetical protein
VSALDNIAPYPRSEKEATAEAIARCFTAYAQLHFRLGIDHPDRDQAAKSTTAFASYYAIAYLLRELIERAGHHVADPVARTLWEDQETVDGLGASVWEWLEEYDIDPERINKVAADVIAEAAQAEQSGGAE